MQNQPITFNKDGSIVFNFQLIYPYEVRRNEACRIRKKYSDRVPIICEVYDPKTIQLTKSKYLTPLDITVGQFLYMMRKKVQLDPSESVYLFTAKNTLPMISMTIKELDRLYKNDDGFLYILLSIESTFG